MGPLKAMVAFGLAAGLAACSAGVEPEPQTSRPAAGVPEVLGGPSDTAEGAPAVGEDGAAPPAPEPRPEAGSGGGAELAVVRPGPRRSFAELVGLTDSQVRAELGSPQQISERPPALVWRYDFPGCVLQLFLFADVASGAAKALTFEAVAAPTESEIDARCARVLADG